MSAGSSIRAAITCARSPNEDFSCSNASTRVPDSVTTAPCPCNVRAMAPPMPPEAPVTSAALPERSNIGSSLDRFQESFDVGRGVESNAGHLLVDALHQTRQHLARSALDQRIDILRLHVLHAFAPTHHAADLFNHTP